VRRAVLDIIISNFGQQRGMGRVVFHVDFDYFYAQCEEIRNPALKGRPVAVCVFSDRGDDSGAIATANYVARDYGVRSGMPIKFAKNRLEGAGNAVFLPVDFGYYSEVSERAMRIMSGNADVFEYVGRDEAYLDVTKRAGGSFKTASHLAQQIKNQIREGLRLTCSIGVSPNKMVSKIASDFEKPDGLTVVEPERVEEFLDQLRIRDIPGIGRKTEERFSEMGLETIGELRGLDVFRLNQVFGRRGGTHIYNSARGIDNEPVREREPSVQYSRIVTLKEDSKDFGFLLPVLREICGQLHRTVLKDSRMFKSVGIQFFQSDLSSRTKSRMLRNPTDSLGEMERAAEALLGEALEGQELPVRRLGVKVSELTEVRGQSSITSYF